MFYLADGPGDSSCTARGFQSTAPMGFLQSGVQTEILAGATSPYSK